MGPEGIVSAFTSLIMRQWDGIIFLVIIIFVGIYWIIRGKNINSLNTGREELSEKFCQKHGLSTREKEIACLLLSGKTNPEIGEELYISKNTVRNHVYHIYKKLNVSTRIELVNKIKP